MSKSLQKGILFAVCILLVCALGVTLFIFDGTGGAVTGQEGQASGVADAAANAYEHGTDSGRRPAGTYTPVSTGEAFYNAIKSNTQDILLTGNITLTSTTSTSGNFIWNNNSQCFMQNTPFNHKIYGAGYTITIEGPHTSSQGMQMNSADSHDYGGLVSRLERSGAIYDLKVVITKGFSIETWECYTQTWPASNVDYWLNVGGIVGYMAGGAVIDNVYVELAESSVRLASFKYNSRGSTSQYVRAGGIVGEMGSGATITNVTVNNKGLIVAGQNSGSGSHSLATERYWGAAGNVVGWAAANGGNITIDNVRTTGNGTIRSYMSANIGVGENSNITTVNFYDNFTGTYDSTNTRHNVYLNGETGSNFYVTNVYRKGTSSSAGSGAENTATGLRIANTLTVPSDSAYDIYFDATVSDRNNSLAIAFNQAPAASYEYTLVSGKGNTYTDYETTSNAIVFRNLPTDATIWKSGNNFTATLNSELLFNPDTYENPLTKYEHGYTEGQTTSSGRAIATGEEWENIFAPSASGTPSGTYYLTDDIVINGFTGKSMSGVTIDGNGKTIFVIGTTQSSYSGSYVGGLVGDFTGGTIKNVRVVYINSCSIASTGTNPRFGLVAGSVNGSKIENVQVYVESGVTISASKAGDNSVAMGGVVGYATNNSKFTNVTLDLNGTLAPTGSYQYLGGIVGLIDSANGATFTNIILRGAGTFAGTAGNTSGEPTYYGAVGVIMAASTNITSAYATIDGLIYDFDVTLAGTGGGGQSNNSYSCYYLFTNNYNAGASGGHKTDSPISGYEGGVTYSNIFVAEKYVSELEGFAGERTNGNAAVGIGSDTTIKKIAGEVTGVSGATVTAYFVPTGNNSDITLAASQPSGGWGGVSQLKSDGDSSAQSVDDGDMKVVTVAKANAATDNNKVTLSEYVPGTVVTVTGVAPQLVYSAAEQGATFTFEGGSPELTTHYSVVYAVNEEDPKGAQLGDTGLPLNAGNYTATITLNEDSGFVFTSADGGYTRQTTFEFAVNPYELTLQSGIATALAGTYGDYTVTSGAVSGDKITSLTQETLFGSSVPGTVAYTITVADQNDGLLNASTYSFTAGVSDTNYNLASDAIDGVVVSPYRVEGTWTYNGGLTITYGDPVPSDIDQYISVSLTTSDIPGGLTSVAASGFDIEYTQGTAAGTTVNIIEGTYAVDSGSAGNYDFTGITGSGTVEVQKKELTITDLGEDASHITDSYGSNVTSLEDLATLFETEGMSYVQGVYENQAVTFTITAFTYDRYYDDGADGAFEEGADATSLISGRLYAKTYYTATVTLASDNAVNDNYELAEGSTFVYYIEPLVIEITGAEFAGGGTSVLYDGNAHEIQVVYTGALDGDNLTFTTNVFYNSESFEGTALTNAGEYTIDVSFDPQNAFHGEANYNYDIGVDGSENTPYTLTISPITLTISDKSGVYTDFVAADIVIDDMVSGILEGDTEGVTVTPAWDTPLADEDGYLAANTYNATLSLGGDKAVNYTFGSDNVATVTVSRFDLSGAQVTITSAPFTYNGNEQTVLYTVLTGEGGKDITSVLTPTGNTQTNAGDNYTLTLTGGSNFTGSATVNWSIAKADYNMEGVTFESESVTYDGTEKTITVSGTLPTGADDIQVTVSYSGTNGTALTNAGSTEITATFATTSTNYNEPEVKTATLTITPVTLTINDISGNYTDYTAADIVIDDMVSGILEGDTEGVTITPAWDTPLADEDGWLAANTYNATLSLGGDKAVNYTFGSDNVATVTVSRFDLSGAQVTITSAPFTYNGNEQTVLYTVLTGEGGKDITSVLTPTGNTQTNAGDNYTLTLTGGSNFTRSATVNWSIAKKDVTFAWSVSGEIVEGMAADEVKALATETNNGGILEADKYTFGVDIGDYSESTLQGTAVTFTPSVTFTEEGDAANYNITFSPETEQLTVQLGKVEIGVTQATVNTDYVNGYTSAAQFLANFTTSVPDVTIDGENFTVTVTPKAAVGFGSLFDVGEYTVTLTSGVYSLAGTLTYDYVVTATQWTASVAAPEGGLTYDGTDKLGSLVITGDNAGAELEGAPEIAAYVEGGMINANAYTVTLRLQTAEGAVYEGGNFILAAASAEIEIAKRVVEISWAEDTDLIYNGTAHTLTATADFVSGESIDLNSLIAYTGDVTDGSAINAGSYTATITKAQIEEQNANYTLAAESVTQEFTISPATLTLTQTAGATLTRPYDGTTTEATSFLTETYVTITGGVSGENIYGMLNAELTSGVEIKNAGGYVITVTFNAEAEGAGNYSVGDFTSLEIGYTVTAKTITITFDGYEGLTYDGQARTLTATADFVSGESIDLDALIAYTGNVTDGEAVNAGSYTATITKAQIKEQNANYTLAAESATQEFTISPATLTLTQTDGAQLSRVYNGNATEAGTFVSADYFTVSGYVDGGNVYDLFTAAVAEGLTIQNADSYTINITLNSGAEGAGNYTCETFAINYEVTPIQWTASVAAPEGGLTYDGTNKLGSLVITHGDNAGEELEGALEIVATVTGGSMVNAGTYTVTLQLQKDGAVYSGGNYELTAESAKIEIAKRVVEISWAEASNLTYNGLEHTLTATVRNKVEPDEVNATVELVGDNVKVTEKGFTYTVTGLEGTAAENYTIVGAENLTSETQHIVRATLTVQFEGINGLVYTGTAHTVTATATGWQNSENYDSTLNGLITIGGDDTQALNAGDYTATITVAALEAALGNYTLAQDATVEFTVAPATLNLTIEMKESGSGASVANPFTWKVDGAVTVSKTADGWTLTSGETSYTVTVTGADGVASDVLQLTLNGSEYTGTPYGTRVQEGKLAVASTDSNYKVVATPIIINIEPDISIEINTGAEYPVSAKYSKDKTYTAADDFAGYFYIDGQPEGTWDYSVEGVESGSFSNVGTYTVKATFTITASSIQLENHFTFTITQATVTDVVLNGEGAYTYGGLKAGDAVSVKVTYSDDYTATVNATFKAATSTGGYVKAGESVVLTLTGDDGKNANYAKVDDSQTVTVSVSKAKITADIYYEDTASADGVLTLTYHGKEGYVVSVKLTGVRDGDVIYGALPTQIIDAGTYNSFEIALNGDDSGSYVITNAADLSVRVTPKEITVEWSNFEGFTYDGTAKTPTATAKGTFDSDKVPLSVTVTGDNATEEGQAINAGDYTATVAAFVQDNYKLSADSVQSFSIAKATATLGIENYQDSVVYNAGAVTVTPTVNGAAAADGIVNVTIAYTADGSEAVSADEIRNAGSYTVTLQISGALNYEDASQEFVITVTRAQLTVTTANNSFIYGDKIDLGATVTAIGDDDVSVAIDRVVSGEEPAELKNAGSYTVTYRLEGAAAGNYKIIAGGSVEVTVDAKALTFTWNSDQTFTYNSEAQVPGYTLDGVVDGDEVTVTVTVTGETTEGQAINAGEYTASVAEITKGNYSLTGVQQFPFTIGKANLTLTPDSVKFSDRDAEKLSAYSKTNYEATIKAGVTVTGVGSDGMFNDFTVTTGASFTDDGTLTVGNYTFTVSVAGGNYNDATYTVTVIEQTVAEFTAKPSSPTYTGGEITFTFANEEGIQLEEGVQITVSGITFNNASAASVLDAGNYTVTFAVTGNSVNNNYWYKVSDWSGSISPATVTANAVTAVYGDVYTAQTGGNLLNGGVWQFVTFNGSPVEVTVTGATARAGETYLGVNIYDVTVTLVSGNYTFEGGSNSVASTLQITPKQLNIAAQLPEDLTYTSEGVVIGLEDYASQLVGDDNVTVSMLVDGEPYVAGVTVLGAGQHTVTVTMTDTSGNYRLAAAQQTFTVEKKEVSSSITVSGETIENNSSLEIVHGENARVQNAIDNYLTQNGVEEGEYTLTVTDSAGQAADLDNISAWAPGTYTVNLGLSDNFEGGMTFTIVVQEGTTAQIPDAPVLPSTPLEDGGSSGAANWLFPLIIAIECLIAVALIVAIVISAIKRGKNA